MNVAKMVWLGFRYIEQLAWRHSEWAVSSSQGGLQGLPPTWRKLIVLLMLYVKKMCFKIKQKKKKYSLSYEWNSKGALPPWFFGEFSVVSYTVQLCSTSCQPSPSWGCLPLHASLRQAALSAPAPLLTTFSAFLLLALWDGNRN